MALISKATINEVNNRLDAVGIVGDYVRLEKKSGRWWGRCPFHAGGQEKTPSFKVDPDLKTYHCFGCGAGGSVISFVMEMEKITYPEAIKNIAKKMSIEIVYEEGAENDYTENTSKEELFELYRRVTVTFQHFLNDKTEGQGALHYLENRGISREMTEKFKLGFAPAERDFLYNFLKQKGYSDDFLGKTGLFSARYKTISLFAGRLIFPIADRQGRIVAFGGRAIPRSSGLDNSTESSQQNDGKDTPKYINSPETEIYKKGQTLYAIEHAKTQMRQSKTAYLAEGYMDVIALHQAGITNAVAPLGTAFTDEQASWLRRWVEKTVLIFDNDEAGQTAAYKAILTCRKNSLSCDLVNLGDAVKKETDRKDVQNLKDPADILKEFTPQILNNIMNCTINDFEYLISTARWKLESGLGIKGAAEFLFPFLEALDSEIERNDYTTRIADAVRTERNAVQKDYTNWKKDGQARTALNEKQNEYDEAVKRNAELLLLTAVAVNMELYGELRTALEIKEIDDRSAKELFIALEECYQHDESGIDSLLSRIKNEPLKKFIVKYGDSPEFKGSSAEGLRKLMEDGINEIRKKKLRKRLNEISIELRNIERMPLGENGQPTAASQPETSLDIDDLLAEKKDIDMQIRKLEGK